MKLFLHNTALIKFDESFLKTLNKLVDIASF